MSTVSSSLVPLFLLLAQVFPTSLLPTFVSTFCGVCTFLLYIYLFYIYECLLACTCVHTCVPAAPGSRKTALDPLELE